MIRYNATGVFWGIIRLRSELRYRTIFTMLFSFCGATSCLAGESQAKPDDACTTRTATLKHDAEGGVADAQLGLGLLHASGQCFPQDYSEALSQKQTTSHIRHASDDIFDCHIANF